MFDLSLIQGLGQALLGRNAVKNVAKRNYGDVQMGAATQDIQRLSQALGNPNDQLYKEYEAQETDKALQDYQLGLQDLITANRRQQSLGRTPLFDAERGGEQLYRAMLLGRGSVGGTARDAANKRIQAGLSASGLSARSGAAASDMERERRTIDELGDYRFYSGLSDAILPRREQPMEIYWNQPSRVGAY